MAIRGVLFVLLVAVGLGLLLREAMPEDVGRLDPVVRVGTFDNRAVAVAYAHSDFMKQDQTAVMNRHAQARKAGDQKLLARIERGQERRQWLMHRQGFGVESVRDLLRHVEPGLARVAHDQGLSLIAWEPMCIDFDQVQLVDVTDQIVELFEPDDPTRAMIARLRESTPIDVGFEFDE
jgi:hypothetical protein